MVLSDIEDDIDLPIDDERQAKAPRRLSRLKKAQILKSFEESEVVDTLEDDNRSTSVGAVLAQEEEDEEKASDGVSIKIYNAKLLSIYFCSSYDFSLLLSAGRCQQR